MATELIIDWRPLDAGGVDDPAEAATWSELRIHVREQSRVWTLTSAADTRARTLLDGAWGTVLPLAEWVVRAWPGLFALTDRPRDPAAAWLFDRTHALRFAGEGCALPHLVITRESTRNMLLRWAPDPEPAPWTRLRFTERGEARLPVSAVRRALTDFVDGVLARLRAVAPDHPRTVELAERRAQIDDDVVVDAQRLVSLEHRWWWEIAPAERDAALHVAGSPMAAYVRAAMEASPGHPMPAAMQEARAIAAAAGVADPAPPPWLELRGALRRADRDLVNGLPPWGVGWQRAEALRSTLGGDPLESFAASLVPTATALRDASGARVPVAWRAHRAPVRGGSGRRGPAAKRFETACALYPALYLGRPDRDVAVVLQRDCHFGVHAEARAFATELVAPIEDVRREVGAATGDYFRMLQVAARLRAPPECVVHQVENRMIERG